MRADAAKAKESVTFVRLGAGQPLVLVMQFVVLDENGAILAGGAGCGFGKDVVFSE